MEPEDYNAGMEQLKTLLLDDIEKQEGVLAHYSANFVLYQKIFRRITIIYVTVALILLTGISLLIYVTTHPLPASQATLHHIEILEQTITYQQKFNQQDRADLLKEREDIAKARTQVSDMQRTLFTADSLFTIKKHGL